MASPSHRRSRRERRTAPVAAVAGAAVVAVALVVSLVMGFRPGGEAGAGEAAATPVAGAEAVASPAVAAPKPSGSSSSSATPPASPSATAGTATPSAGPSAAATSAPARPTADSSRRTSTTGAPLAGRIRPGVDYRGVATSYDAGDGDGACSFGPSDDLMIAAMNTADYETSKACGAHVLVRADNGASVTVRITNECPAPCAPGQLDLSTQAFAKLADLSAGRIAITWSLLSPSTSDTVSIRYKTGSSRYWCGIQALGHRNPLARLEVRTSSGWASLARTEYNYFLSEQGTGCGGAIRITDIHGERLTIDGIALRPEAVQATGVQFAAH
ncbi:expansin EXLX1 family cellulose-binding protein [Streptomyces sp. NPDC014995]|uniref:expansin EXLX1 family cellulose-binding protein n=1 Tax=Streptomyces sp. NPDC014995 TaxID=3364936 RepID=UPI0036FA7EDD